ncbi:hypothetical protein [Piscinibacter terrae]|uniref:ATPase with chaperone activity n=1 Tax=Piscinibacter terrae TaxID=2496871 RepID=A0A3N7JW38_9BURK|nr:hypothetical protein [Albitalea terrae]RQP25059.1 hypothetical protein DZC73_09395 [Albitalea terrae]
MSDEYQIEVPPSFIALYTDSRRRLTLPVRDLRQRYELCEDLSQQLVDHARTTHFAHGISQDEVLLRMHRGLTSPEPQVEAAEAGWVVRRLAELLEWDPITLPDAE